MWKFDSQSLVYKQCVFVDGQCLSYIYRGAVVNENGMNQPLTMALKEKLKDLKSCHF